MKILSDRVRKWIRTRLEKSLERYNEGPEPPRRFEQAVQAFAAMHPFATRADFVSFATRFCGECYRAGYMRGLEWAEREDQQFEGRLTPEQAMEAIDPEWRYSPPVDLRADTVVPETVTDDERRALQIAVINQELSPRRF